MSLFGIDTSFFRNLGKSIERYILEKRLIGQKYSECKNRIYPYPLRLWYDRSAPKTNDFPDGLLHYNVIFVTIENDIIVSFQLET